MGAAPLTPNTRVRTGLEDVACSDEEEGRGGERGGWYLYGALELGRAFGLWKTGTEREVEGGPDRDEGAGLRERALAWDVSEETRGIKTGRVMRFGS